MEPTQKNSRPAETLGLYLAVPFCRSKCTFCNFASGVFAASDLPRYVGHLLHEIRSARSWATTQGLLCPEQLESIYFGGGTPSILSPTQLRQIFAALRAEFSIAPHAEITLEAAPSFLAPELLEAALDCGLTRVSFGVQSFIDTEARATGRLHTTSQALEDVRRVQAAGAAAGVDLIAGLPGQTTASWNRSLETLTEQARPEHASVYMLEVDEDSRLGQELLLGGVRYGASLVPDDDLVADMYAGAVDRLAQGGLAQYEISNFARPGFESRHNNRYWERAPYLGLGLDAHSMLRDTTGRATRFGTGDNLKDYLDQNPGTLWSECNRLTPAEELEEAWFLGLRKTKGVNLAQLQQQFGPASVSAFEPVIERLLGDALLEWNTNSNNALEHTHLRLTQRGRMVSNEVFAAFLDVTPEQTAEPETSPPATA